MLLWKNKLCQRHWYALIPRSYPARHFSRYSPMCALHSCTKTITCECPAMNWAISKRDAFRGAHPHPKQRVQDWLLLPSAPPVVIFSLCWRHERNLLLFWYWQMQLPWYCTSTHKSAWRQRWCPGPWKVGSTTHDPLLETLCLEISLVSGAHWPTKHWVGQNRLWKSIGWPIHNGAHWCKVFLFAKQLMGWYPIFTFGGECGIWHANDLALFLVLTQLVSQPAIFICH